MVQLICYICLWTHFLLQIIHSIESSALRDLVQVSDIKETITGFLRLCALKARLWNIWSVSSHLRCPGFFQLSYDRSLPMDKATESNERYNLAGMYRSSITHDKINRWIWARYSSLCFFYIRYYLWWQGKFGTIQIEGACPQWFTLLPGHELLSYIYEHAHIYIYMVSSKQKRPYRSHLSPYINW